jgi:hypothetical protein
MSFDLAAFNLAITGLLRSGRTTLRSSRRRSVPQLGLYLVAGRRRADRRGPAPVAVGPRTPTSS